MTRDKHAKCLTKRFSRFLSGRPERSAGVMRRAGAGCTLVTGLLFCAAVDAATLYRFINEKGYQEIGYTVPNHLVPNGYDVIDQSGRLVRRVAPQLSEEEYAAKLERERKLEACQKAMVRVRRRYESLDDIDLAERKWAQQLEDSLRNDESNLEYARTLLGEGQEKAAAYERRGQAIPDNLLQSIDRSEEQISALLSQIEGRQRQRRSKEAAFAEERRMYQLDECTLDQPIANR